MSKFISKKYQLAFEDVTGTLESTVIEETGLSVDNVIEGLNNDIELQEAGKEYKTNRDKMEEALEVVSGLELLKEKNDELIANGGVTGDDVLASQEALCQASAILGLNIQTLSFETVTQDPKQALVLSNEGIVESIGKGINAIIKFFKDLFNSIWKFISGLFSRTDKIKESNDLTIKLLDKVVDDKEVNKTIQNLTTAVVNNESDSDIKQRAVEYGGTIARYERAMGKITNLANFDQSTYDAIANQNADIAIKEAEVIKNNLNNLKGASVLCGVCGVDSITPNTVRSILETMDQVVGFKAFHRLDSALAITMEAELKFITDLSNELLPISALESSWNNAKLDATGQTSLIILDKLKEAVSKLANKYHVTYNNSLGIGKQIEEICLAILDNKFKDFKASKGLKEDPISDLERFVKYYDHMDKLDNAFVFPVSEDGNAISLSFGQDDLTKAGSVVVLKRFLSKSATSIENDIMTKSDVEPIIGILSHTNSTSDSISVIRYINKYISLYNIKDMHMLSRVEQGKENIFRFIEHTEANIARAKLSNTSVEWLIKHYSRNVVSNISAFSNVMQQPIVNMGRVYKVLSGYVKINARMLVKLGIKKDA